MSQSTVITEADIFADLLDADRGDFSAEVARSVLRWKFTEHAQARMTDLADRNNRGAIGPGEREELEKYLRVGSFINIVQAKARLSLRQQEVIA